MRSRSLLKTGPRATTPTDYWFPTEYFSSRRVRRAMRHEMDEIGVEVLVPALDDPEYPRTGWWQNEKGVVSFQNEVIKYLYYRLKYGSM